MSSLTQVPLYIVTVLSTITIFSLWAGYTIGLHSLVLVIGLGMGLIVARRAMEHSRSIPHTRSVYTWVGVLFILYTAWAAHTLFIQQGGFDLSADATPAVVASHITSHIPSTYGPLLDVPFYYQLGLPLLASYVDEWIPAYVALWALALVGVGLALFFMVNLVQKKNFNAHVALLSGLLFLGTRYPYLSQLNGEYPWQLSLGIGLAGIIWAAEKKLLGMILFAGAMIIHPYIGAGAIVFWVLYEQPSFSSIVKTCAGVLIAIIPIIFFQALPFLSLEHAANEIMWPAISGLLAIPSVVGVISFVIVTAGVFFSRPLRSVVANRPLMVGIFFLVAGIVAMAIPTASLAYKILQWAGIAFVMAATFFLYPRIQKNWKMAVGVLFVLIILIVAASHDLQRLQDGSKATLAEAQFAERVRAYDNSYVRVLFLSSGAGKMGEYSNKIPTEILSANYTLALHLLRTPEAIAYRDESEESKRVRTKKCAECVSAFDVRYIVVNTREFPRLSNRTILLEDDGFILYAGS